MMSEKYIKNFKDWNNQAILLNAGGFSDFFYEREIWWCALGTNIGSEQDGKNSNFERPVLIVRKINKDLLFMVPLTSKISETRDRIMIDFAGKESQVLLSQGRTISCKRLLRKIGYLKIITFYEIIALLSRSFLEIIPIKGETPP